MSGDVSAIQEHADESEHATMKQSEQTACANVSIESIPKLEPSYFNESDYKDELSNGLILSPIPFTTPYKVRDPIVLLEKCDKIWETLKVIKDVQRSKSFGTLNGLPSGITNENSLYVKYHPVLGNNNTALPNFKFSIKTKKRLFHCSVCGKLYTTNRSLRFHSERVHGILIPLKRNKNPIVIQTKIDKSKESNAVEIEKDNVEKLDSASIKKDKEKRITHKELKQNGQPTVSHHDSVSQQQCVLCKQTVKNIRKHLTDYHKIEGSDLMLQELEKTSTAPKVKEFNKTSDNDEPIENNGIIKGKYSLRCKQKRKQELDISSESQKKKTKLNNNDDTLKTAEVGSRQCEICFGMYSPHSISKHMRRHHIRGETKENFHLFSCNYSNSPLCIKQKGIVNSSNVFSENTNNNNRDTEDSFTKKRKQKQMFKSQGTSGRSPNKNADNHEFSCSCGRLFRNPHTMYLHKSTCHLNSVQNNCDRDSGIGISITIKKKNNSYEVVGRDVDEEKELQNFSNSEDTNTLSDITEDDDTIDSQNQQYDILESSKYSENHSILRIQFVDEDTDVDIEDDSQYNVCNNDTSDRLSANKITNNFRNEELKQTINVQKNMGKNEDKRCSESMFSVVTKNKMCVCGNKFNSRKDLNIHINKYHKSTQLICGYCKENFHDITAWHKHECSIEEGDSYVDPPFEIHCHYCRAILNSFAKFDDHIRQKHYDSVVPYQCFHCRKRFSNATSRKLHFHADHSLPTCPICEKEYMDTVKSKHEAYHYGLGFPCHLCKKTYCSKQTLLKHKGRVHLGPS
ncbi:uncharacterized protein LOC128889307 [Hylaeus anthracinus]|uniref:uncharacterized protein LOC128889307 n=1 Tax=Hylaeus anthracinus TaxID=313031 RepID=UPI0023B9867F|nr:uncharacterized protein LOC128889307 [Hylaeus anthracinus]XP_054002819.1 uncharacterized protein LOC128889307 [Hylaeus anthracinus]XP_054002821.1 uncharacterized protein LOC128889307 [Hylaeus anthracinus]XP_054002822.1 uncharacterized protein LOC128889307 [Hylaeus anthracinus]